MRKNIVIFLVVFCLFFGAGIGAEAFALEIGQKAPSFNLPGVDGKKYSLEGFSSKPVLVVIFSCNHCPYAQAYEDRIVAVQRDFEKRGAQLVMINANDAKAYPDDGFEPMKQRAAEKGFNFPYLRDESQEIAKAYGAQRTPHIYVFDEGRALRYTGKIDDNWENASDAKTHYLSDAIEALLSGQEPKEAKTFAIGCTIKWKS